MGIGRKGNCRSVGNKMKVIVAQSCPMDYTVHGILQVRILEWSLYSLPPQGIFPTQGLNPGLSHSRQILYKLSHKGSQKKKKK